MSMVYGDDDFLPADDLAAAAAQHGINLDSRTGQDEVVGVKITRWRDMPAEERPAAWDELRDFVEWITTHYEHHPHLLVPTPTPRRRALRAPRRMGRLIRRGDRWRARAD
jgi:hypothetical protein